MCLDYILDEKPPVEGYFYKIFSVRFDETISFEYYYDIVDAIPNIWLSSSDIYWVADNYRHGFHGFETLDGARYWQHVNQNIKKCKYYGGHTIGLQNKHRTIVADKIMILDEDI